MGLQPISVQDNTFDYSNDLKFQKWLSAYIKTDSDTFDYANDSKFKKWLQTNITGISTTDTVNTTDTANTIDTTGRSLIYCADGTCIIPSGNVTKLGNIQFDEPNRTIYVNNIRGNNNSGLDLYNNNTIVSLTESDVRFNKPITFNGTSNINMVDKDINLNTGINNDGSGKIIVRGDIELQNKALSSAPGNHLYLTSGSGAVQVNGKLQMPNGWEIEATPDKLIIGNRNSGKYRYYNKDEIAVNKLGTY